MGLVEKELPSDKIVQFLPEGTSYQVIGGKLVFTLPDGEVVTEGDELLVKIKIGPSKVQNGTEKK